VADFFDNAFRRAGSGLVTLVLCVLILGVLILCDGGKGEETEGENKEFGVHDVLLAVEIPETEELYSTHAGLEHVPEAIDFIALGSNRQGLVAAGLGENCLANSGGESARAVSGLEKKD
jgi:hypothetical protein